MDGLKEQMTKRYAKGSVIAVVCNQWGDTGKGAIVDRFMNIANICVRATGADNCGHTVEANGKKYVSHMIPSGVIFDSEGLVSVIARDVAFNPLTAERELEEFAKAGITHNNLKISFRAKLIMPHHILLDMLSESRASKATKIGTTGRGVGPVFQDHVARTGLTVMDMLQPKVMRAKLQNILRDKIAFMKTLDSSMVKEVLQHERLEKGRFYDSKNILNIDAIVSRYAEHGKYFEKMICDTETYLKSQLGKATIVFEGAQGALLDINQGTYPFVTSSRCTTAGLVNGAALHESDVTESLGVVKAYVTRVGEGSFPTEIGGYDAVSKYKNELREKMADIPLLEQMNSTDEIVQGGALGMQGNEFGATTGRPRRTGWMDLPALRYSVGINGPKIIITKLDVLTGIKQLPICVRYRYDGPDNSAIPLKNGQELETMIPEDGILKYCRPIYEYVEGWNEDISGARSWEELPKATQKYLSHIEKETGAKIIMIGVGPERDQTFFR
jgi:adenylosuccinate synthase